MNHDEKLLPNFMTYNNGNLLFHYTKFESALKIIASRTLLFGDFDRMNDISEAQREVYNEIAIQELKQYKSISLTIDKPHKRGFAIDPLWGYYAEGGNGVCLAFDKQKLLDRFKETFASSKSRHIRYLKDFTNIVLLKTLEENKVVKEEVAQEIANKYKEIFFTKSKDWRLESEYRLLIKSTNIDRERLLFGDALSAVIICQPLAEDIKKTCAYCRLKQVVNDVPILHYHTALGSKTLTNIVDGKPLWPLHGVDYELDCNAFAYSWDEYNI